MLRVITTYAELDGPRLMAVYAESNLENTDYFFPEIEDKALAVRKVEEGFLQFLREEEDVWDWVIDDAYIAQVQKSFDGDIFRDALSFLAYLDGQAVGRIDACLIRSHFDGSTKAYLDWICVIKSYRHRGVGQALLERLRQELKARGVDTLIALTASNEEAQRFYKHVPDSILRDTGIWIDI